MNTIHSPPPGHTSIRNICVFCGSGPGRNPAYEAAANVLGRAMAAAGIGLVYGGGSLGLMGVVARSVLGAGGRVTGIIPSFLSDREMMLRDVDELIVTEDMHQRKRLMFDRSDAFVALPGGFGTYEEILEIITWGQLGLHRKPIGLLNLKGYYQPLLAQVDRGVEEGFIKPSYRQLLVSADKPAALLEALAGYEPPEVEQWLAAGET